MEIKVKLGEYLEIKKLKDYIISHTQFITSKEDFDKVYIKCIEQSGLEKIYIIDDTSLRNDILQTIISNNEGRNTCINCNTNIAVFNSMVEECNENDVKICYNILQCKDIDIIKQVLKRMDVVIII